MFDLKPTYRWTNINHQNVEELLIKLNNQNDIAKEIELFTYQS